MINPEVVFGRLGNKLFQYATLYAHAKDLGVDFYFQDEKYFKKYENEIKELFGEGIGFLDFVAIHVRRGANPINPDEPNYSDNPFYVNLSETDYYKNAIALFPKDNFLVFSDDPEWCKKNFFDFKRFQVMEKGDEIEDFNLMASCKSQIIANSSYSFWAGWLNPNPAKKVVAPKEWYRDGINRTVIPETWIKI